MIRNKRIIRFVGFITFGFGFLLIGTMATQKMYGIPISIDAFNQLMILITIIVCYFFLDPVDNNHGYDTQKQLRFNAGDEVKISKHKSESTKFKVGSTVTIVETCRYDYLIVNDKGDMDVVYQFELYKEK